ncbi:MAG: hypothetical protein V1659_00590 [Candidatus Woesearchaeota archaeon]
MKKGMSSIEIIIATALGLIILVVLAVLIFRSAGNATTGTACAKQGGVCRENCNPSTTWNEVTEGQASCGTGKFCCRLAVEAP